MYCSITGDSLGILTGSTPSSKHQGLFRLDCHTSQVACVVLDPWDFFWG